MNELISKEMVRRIIDSPRNKEQMLRMLESIPSAQPEIIRCEDCKYLAPIYTGGAGVCGHWNAKTEEHIYCAYAERRNDVSDER